MRMPEAIDPMALILTGEAYLIWLEIHHPHTPEEWRKEIEEQLAVATPEMRRDFARRAEHLGEFVRIVEQAAAREFAVR